jgi:hypothetical protein
MMGLLARLARRSEQRYCCCTQARRAAVLKYLTCVACRTTELVLRAATVAGRMNACALAAAQASTTIWQRMMIDRDVCEREEGSRRARRPGSFF